MSASESTKNFETIENFCENDSFGSITFNVPNLKELEKDKENNEGEVAKLDHMYEVLSQENRCKNKSQLSFELKHTEEKNGVTTNEKKNIQDLKTQYGFFKSYGDFKDDLTDCIGNEGFYTLIIERYNPIPLPENGVIYIPLTEISDGFKNLDFLLAQMHYICENYDKLFLNKEWILKTVNKKSSEVKEEEKNWDDVMKLYNSDEGKEELFDGIKQEASDENYYKYLLIKDKISGGKRRKHKTKTKKGGKSKSCGTSKRRNLKTKRCRCQKVCK